MSYRVGTPNYNLPQTEGTDKRDWTDTNQAFLAIDTAIKNAVDTSASASSAAGTAQQTADSANTAAAHAQTDATTAQTLATSASELAATAKNRADSAYTLADSAYTLAIDVNQKSIGTVLGSYTPTATSTRGEIATSLGSVYAGLTLAQKQNCKIVRNDGMVFRPGSVGQFIGSRVDVNSNQVNMYTIDVINGKYLVGDIMSTGTSVADWSTRVDTAGRTHSLVIG